MLIRPPATESEFEAYYTMRWKILREPWDEPLGSEKDEFEGEAIHLAAWNDDGKLIGVGRLHSVAGTCGQIRYMAVDRTQRGHGVGQAILRELENRALGLGLEEIKLNSRQDAMPFYERNGYQVLRPSHTLFGTIPHFDMRKQLRMMITFFLCVLSNRVGAPFQGAVQLGSVPGVETGVETQVELYKHIPKDIMPSAG